MTATFYRISKGYIIEKRGDDERVLDWIDDYDNKPGYDELLHRANTQPGLLEALENAAHALEITADFVAGIHNAPGVDPCVPPDSATVEGIRNDAHLARAALSAATPKGE